MQDITRITFIFQIILIQPLLAAGTWRWPVMNRSSNDWDGASAIGTFKKNALILLALVDNAENIRFELTNGTRKLGFNYGRLWAEETVNGDVRDYAASPELLQELIDNY